MVVRARGYRCFWTAFFALAGLVCVWPGIVGRPRDRVVFGVLLVVWAALAVRAWRVRVVVNLDEVVVHRLLVAKRVPRAQIAMVLTADFQGAWPAEIPVDWWRQLFIRRTDGVDVKLPLVALDRRGDGGALRRIRLEFERLLEN